MLRSKAFSFDSAPPVYWYNMLHPTPVLRELRSVGIGLPFRGAEEYQTNSRQAYSNNRSLFSEFQDLLRTSGAARCLHAMGSRPTQDKPHGPVLFSDGAYESVVNYPPNVLTVCAKSPLHPLQQNGRKDWKNNQSNFTVADVIADSPPRESSLFFTEAPTADRYPVPSVTAFKHNWINTSANGAPKHPFCFLQKYHSSNSNRNSHNSLSRDGVLNESQRHFTARLHCTKYPMEKYSYGSLKKKAVESKQDKAFFPNRIVPTARIKARLAQIPNLLGPYICKLCHREFRDPFHLAGHRCPCIIHTDYRCPECEKVFNCPANLASHRRWHKPKRISTGLEGINSLGSNVVKVTVSKAGSYPTTDGSQTISDYPKTTLSRTLSRNSEPSHPPDRARNGAVPWSQEPLGASFHSTGSIKITAKTRQLSKNCNSFTVDAILGRTTVAQTRCRDAMVQESHQPRNSMTQSFNPHQLWKTGKLLDACGTETNSQVSVS